MFGWEAFGSATLTPRRPENHGDQVFKQWRPVNDQCPISSIDSSATSAYLDRVEPDRTIGFSQCFYYHCSTVCLLVQLILDFGRHALTCEVNHIGTNWRRFGTIQVYPSLWAAAEIGLHLTLDGPVEKLIGRTIPGTFGPSEYDIATIVSRPGGSTGFVMTEHVDRFRFGPTGHPTRQMQSEVRRVVYEGNGVPFNNWLKQTLLLHDVPRGRGEEYRSEQSEEFWINAPLNVRQKKNSDTQSINLGPPALDLDCPSSKDRPELGKRT